MIVMRIDRHPFREVGTDVLIVGAGAAGLTALYHRSSSRKDENTGDAAALAYEAGAALRDMELVQFHPTGMVEPEEMSGTLVTEAVRGEGGYLLNSCGERFMERYSPEYLELDARDVVARAIYKEIEAGRGTGNGAVLLDISHKDDDYIKERLPRMYTRFKEQGVDITKEPMEVAPTAHYAMGGVAVDFDTGATSLEGLFAIGEGTAGTHGANRLGGNSLAETLVFGEITGTHLVGYTIKSAIRNASPPSVDDTDVEEHLAELDRLAGADGEYDPEDLCDELRKLLWEHAGIVRTGEGLQEGLRQLRELAASAENVATGGISSRKFEYALNLRFMLLAAEAILRGGLLREESRGAHHREDFPETDEGWEKNILYAKDGDGSMQLWTVPVGKIPEEIRAELEKEHELGYHHLE
jgi:succinate dehydrogenase / fumarate reductase, flavoprotein subunit